MKLALGTAQFGMSYGVANISGQVPTSEAASILQTARRAGLDTLDTAIAYGSSEEVLGMLNVQQWQVVTKLPAVPAECKNVTKWVNEQVRASLQRLGIDQLHGLLLHRPSQLLDGIGSELFDAMLSLKDQGLSRKLGVSIYDPSELDSLFDRYRIDLVQAPLNLLDRRLLESGWAARLNASGVEVHSRSAFLQGLLLMENEQRPAKFEPWRRVWSDYSDWLREAQITPLQACIRFVVSNRLLDRVVVGIETASQLNQIIEACDAKEFQAPDFGLSQNDRILNPALWSEL